MNFFFRYYLFFCIITVGILTPFLYSADPADIEDFIAKCVLLWGSLTTLISITISACKDDKNKHEHGFLKFLSFLIPLFVGLFFIFFFPKKNQKGDQGKRCSLDTIEVATIADSASNEINYLFSEGLMKERINNDLGLLNPLLRTTKDSVVRRWIRRYNDKAECFTILKKSVDSILDASKLINMIKSIEELKIMLRADINKVFENEDDIDLKNILLNNGHIIGETRIAPFNGISVFDHLSSFLYTHSVSSIKYIPKISMNLINPEKIDIIYYETN